MRVLAPFLLSLALILSSNEVVLSQDNFEGTIEFTQTKNGKPSYWVYYVKGSMVRVEQMGKDKLIQSVMLVDTKKKTITVLDSKRKNYVEIDAMESVKDMTNTRVTMTKEKRKITKRRRKTCAIFCVACPAAKSLKRRTGEKQVISGRGVSMQGAMRV